MQYDRIGKRGGKMLLSKENEDFVYNFLENELRFYPSSDVSSAWLPFSINRPFTVYDISQMNENQITLLYETAPDALSNCLKNGHQLYSMDWNHSLVLYDPRNPSKYQSDIEQEPRFNSKGIAYFGEFFPDGDYYFHIDRYGYFGYLSHPWREEVWIYGENLLKEFEKIHRKIGFNPKSIIK